MLFHAAARLPERHTDRDVYLTRQKKNGSIKKMRSFPWYDSQFLSVYFRIIDDCQPDDSFHHAVSSLTTVDDFVARRIDIFDDSEHVQMKQTAKLLEAEERFSDHELQEFGRSVIHNHPLFTKIQHRIEKQVSILVGEPVASTYNFLTTYLSNGSCPLHLDHPEAKYTVDHVLYSNQDWPLFYSEPRQWPSGTWNTSWDKDTMKHVRFMNVSLRERDSFLYSGSAQWHYREKITPVATPPVRARQVILFHFTPLHSRWIVNETHMEEKFCESL